MNKSLLTLALLAATAPAVAQGGLLEQHQRTLTLPHHYVCYRTTGTLNIDGIADEADWQQAEPTAPFADISGEGFATPLYETRAKMLWDDDYLYVSAQLEEPNIIAKLSQRDTIIYYDNDFEVFIDPDGDGQNYFEIENNARGVIFDLMLDRPYRCGGNFLLQWDCPGLRLAVHCDGTLNQPADKDRGWSVEMAIPRQALTLNFLNPLQAGNWWRINFSRVQWLKKPEENWVWMPTGKIDMHMPDRWGYIYFSEQTVGQGKETFRYPYNMKAYRLLWSMFYAQQQHFSKTRTYLQKVEDFGLGAADKEGLPANMEISAEVTESMFCLTVYLPDENQHYRIDHYGRFSLY